MLLPLAAPAAFLLPPLLVRVLLLAVLGCCVLGSCAGDSAVWCCTSFADAARAAAGCRMQIGHKSLRLNAVHASQLCASPMVECMIGEPTRMLLRAAFAE